VSGMVRRLADQGLLAYERYHGVRLTESGRRAALRTLRRHRVIEAYLAEALGYQWDRVHEEAERLEHAASDELVDRMAATIGEPEVDPHGAPIPTKDGSVDETEYKSLADLAVGASGVVVRVADEDPEMLRYLGELGFDDTMTPKCTERRAATAFGELHSVVALVGEQSLVGESTHHATHRCGCDRQTLGDFVGRGGTRPFPNRVDRLEVILDWRGEWLAPTHP